MKNYHCDIAGCIRVRLMILARQDWANEAHRVYENVAELFKLRGTCPIIEPSIKANKQEIKIGYFFGKTTIVLLLVASEFD